MFENYHTHTARCHHAIGTDEEYVLCAIEGGLETLGFSDHTPFIFPDGYVSRIRMLPETVAEYASSILALKEKYADRIQIRLGLEVEYFPTLIDGLLELIEPLGIEYMILAQHWCDTEVGNVHNFRPTDNPKQLERYCNQIIEGIQTGLFSYVAHPDIISYTADDGNYEYHMTRLCQAAKTANIPVELNFQGIRENRQYPNDRFWKIAGEVGVPVVLGCDAHAPADAADRKSEERALAIAEQFRLNLLDRIPIHSYRTI